MSMTGKDTADVEWRMGGLLGPFQLVGRVTSTLTVHPLTGKILQHSDRYNFAGTNPVAWLAIELHRLAWASRQNTMDAQEAVRCCSVGV